MSIPEPGPGHTSNERQFIGTYGGVVGVAMSSYYVSSFDGPSVGESQHYAPAVATASAVGSFEAVSFDPSLTCFNFVYSMSIQNISSSKKKEFWIFMKYFFKALRCIFADNT